MKELDKYGRGRKSVIDEMMKYCDDQAEKARSNKLRWAISKKDIAKNAHLAGVISMCARIKVRLRDKLNNLYLKIHTTTVEDIDKEHNKPQFTKEDLDEFMEELSKPTKPFSMEYLISQAFTTPESRKRLDDACKKYVKSLNDIP